MVKLEVAEIDDDLDGEPWQPSDPERFRQIIAAVDRIGREMSGHPFFFAALQHICWPCGEDTVEA